MRESVSPGAVSRLLRRWSGADTSALYERMLVEFRDRAGLTTAQTAEALKVWPPTLERHWTFARGSLRRELKPLRSGPGEGLGKRP